MSRGLNDFNSDYVYRVLRPDEDPDSDLNCANLHSACTIDEHVESGLHTPTRFISTTTDINKALKWMETADNITSRKYKNKRSVIVKIDIGLIKLKYPNVANSAYDLSNSNNRNHFLKNDRQRSFAGAYSEVAFKRSIPSEAVSVCYTTKDGYVNRKAYVTRAIPSEAVLPRTTQAVHSLNQPNYQPGIATKSNLNPIEAFCKPTTLKGINAVVERGKSSSKLSERVSRTRDRGDLLSSTNPETGSLKSRFRPNQVPDHFDYLGYGNVSEHEKRYQPNMVSSSSQRESRTGVKSNLNPTTLETKRHFTQDFLHNQTKKKEDYSAYNDLSDYSSIYQPRTEQPKPQPQPRRNPAYSNVLGYEGSYQPNRSAIPSQFSGASDRIRQSSTDYGITGYSRPSLRTDRSSPEITPDAPRNKPLWKKFFSFFCCPFKSNK